MAKMWRRMAGKVKMQLGVNEDGTPKMVALKGRDIRYMNQMKLQMKAPASNLMLGLMNRAGLLIKKDEPVIIDESINEQGAVA